jgi:hypothetical protein
VSSQVDLDELNQGDATQEAARPWEVAHLFRQAILIPGVIEGDQPCLQQATLVRRQSVLIRLRSHRLIFLMLEKERCCCRITFCQLLRAFSRNLMAAPCGKKPAGVAPPGDRAQRPPYLPLQPVR